jgi:nucleoside-diphosphate-sugar epimerase
MDTTRRTWIVTGFPGWFGNRFIEQLAATEDRVLVLVRPGCEAEAIRLWQEMAGTSSSDRFQCMSIDLADPNASWKRMDGLVGATLVHGAGMIHPKKHVREFQAVNVAGASRLLAWAESMEVSRVVFISSNSQAGCNPHPDHRFTEDSPYHPYMGYGRSKMQMELVGRDWSTRTGVPLTILRPCWFLGPHQPARQARFFEMVANGVFPLLGGGANRRSITFVDDLCQAVLCAATSSSAGVRAYWIALEEPPTMRELVETVQEVMGQDFGLTVKKGFRSLPSFVGSVATGADALIQAAGRYQTEIHVLGELNKTIACDVSLARLELGWRPTPSLRRAVQASVDWYLKHKKG